MPQGSDFLNEAASSEPGSHVGAMVIERREIPGEGCYRAVIEDLEFMWRWKIYRDGEMCQEGCSLSERSSREAVGHVLAFYRVRDGDEGESAAPSSP